MIQVTDIINGKPVIGPIDEVCEVKNAYSAYQKLSTFNPYSLDDLKTAHKLMMDGLIHGAGQFRTCYVGVFRGTELIHEGVHPDFVAEKIESLLKWCEEAKTHPLIKSCIFHYQFEFIHPFADGNGRIGRLWQTCILGSWNRLFLWVPIESVIFKRRQMYYELLNEANSSGDCTHFIEFLLLAILDSLKAVMSNSKSSLAEQIYHIISENPGVNTPEVSRIVDKSSKTVQRYIKQLKDSGKIEFRGAPKNGGYYPIL